MRMCKVLLLCCNMLLCKSYILFLTCVLRVGAQSLVQCLTCDKTWVGAVLP